MLGRAGAWFLNSGIQEENGGVARYYRSDLGKSARVSTEITGYAVSFFVYLFQRTANPAFQEAALRSARFLTRSAWDPALEIFPFEQTSERLAYFFDSGIIVRGLLAIWHLTGEREFRDVAVRAGTAMIANFVGPEDIHPILTLPQAKPIARASSWSRFPGCYQLKSAMAWHDLFEETGRPEFRRAYESALAQALENAPCFLPGDADREKVMDRLHAYAYFLEGLLPYVHRTDCAAAICNGIPRLAAFLSEIAPAFARSDVYAQLLRIRLIAGWFGMVPLDSAVAAQEAKQAARFQLESGGFGFGTKQGAMMPFVNPVSTAFCAQALDMYRLHKAKRFTPNLKALV